MIVNFMLTCQSSDLYHPPAIVYIIGYNYPACWLALDLFHDTGRAESHELNSGRARQGAQRSFIRREGAAGDLE